jgi:hypothetical protein
VKGFWEKSEKIIWFWLMLMIPTQLGKHFWPEWSLVSGVRVDYLSPILYVTDILWLGLVICKLRITNYELLIRKIFNFQNLLMVVFVVVNILVATNKGVAVYKWLRMGQWWWFYRYCWQNRKIVKENLGRIIPWWIAGESLLGLAQIAKGGSLNGLMWWFGERRFSFTTIGIAQISVFGQGLIRAYGTFSHPNSLAGFLVVAVALWTMFRGKIKKMWWWAVVWLGLLGILISGSRTIWLLTLLLMIFNFVKVFRGKIGITKVIGYLAVILGLGILVVGMVGVNYRTSDFLGGWDSDSLSKRMSLNVVAVKMWRENFMIGVGAGNFIPKLPEYQSDNKFYWLQPVHNIFLLAGVEIGMLGIIMMIWLFRDLWERKGIKKKWWLWGLIVLSGMVDHYWLTLPQNTWLLAIVLGII